MAPEQKGTEAGNGSFVDNLREIQGEYMTLTELYERQKAYGQKLSDMMRALQYEVDVTIPIRPETMGKEFTAAYLVSEAVVVAFDKNRYMTSSPLYRLPPDVIISVIEECTPELRRLISEKRHTESGKVRSLERVLGELEKAQATFKQTKRDELEIAEDEREVETKGIAKEPRPEKVVEGVEVASRSQKESFGFKASFSERHEKLGTSS